MPTTDTGRDLLRTICERPDDDDARLVYADWCEETGDVERAEFIRVQCLRDRAPARPQNRDMSFREWERLELRERELLSAIQDAVREEIRGVPNNDVWWDAWTFRRGFVSEVHCRCQAWLDHGPAIVACQPVERVMLVDREPERLTGDWFLWDFQMTNSPLRACDIPVELWNLLPPMRVMQGMDDVEHGVYGGREAALAALSTAALLWARSEAGLPALSDTSRESRPPA